MAFTLMLFREMDMQKTIAKTALASAVFVLSGTAMAFEPLPAKPPIPADNPMTAEKIELGKQLYFDPRLSSDGTVSCNSCHNVMSGGTDNRALSIGVNAQKGGRSSPTVWNAAFLSVQFWDGRAPTLEEQAKGPILNPVEMGMPDAATVITRLSKIDEYQQQFAKVFGGDKPLTYDNLAKAIAAYERTLLTPNSPFDRYLRGDKAVLSDKAVRGMKLVEDVGCTSCHSGPIFAGPQMPAGQGFYQKFPAYTDNAYVKRYGLVADTGRYQATQKEDDRHLWRVATWRNVALTAPYFHNGSVATLDDAVRVMAKTQLNRDLSDAQVGDIVAFLNSLTGEFPAQTLPRLPATPNQALTAD